jgi:P22 coat protein - gene protein 5
VNGYQVGDTINFRRPAQFELREGRIAAPQDVVEGKQSLVVNQYWGVDFRFTTQELTQNIKDISKRVIKPAMVKLANKIDQDLMGLYASVSWWVGTPGQTINSFSDFLVGVQRMDDMAVPLDDRHAVLAPADFHGVLGSASALFMQDVAHEAYRDRKVGTLAGVEIMMAQNVPSHTVGSAATASAVVDAAAGNGVLTTDYDTVKDRDQLYMYLSTDGWDASTLKAGDVLQVGSVNAVNLITKVAQSFAQQFVVLEDTVTASGDTAIKISPPIITSGAFQTVSGTLTDGSNAITKVGTGGTAYRQNMIFHQNAFALAMVPLEKPAGAVDVARKSYKGLSVRVVPYYDGATDVSNWRLDVLYGVKALDNRLAVRVSGT